MGGQSWISIGERVHVAVAGWKGTGAWGEDGGPLSPPTIDPFLPFQTLPFERHVVSFRTRRSTRKRKPHRGSSLVFSSILFSSFSAFLPIFFVFFLFSGRVRSGRVWGGRKRPQKRRRDGISKGESEGKEPCLEGKPETKFEKKGRKIPNFHRSVVKVHPPPRNHSSAVEARGSSDRTPRSWTHASSFHVEERHAKETYEKDDMPSKKKEKPPPMDAVAEEPKGNATYPDGKRSEHSQTSSVRARLNAEEIARNAQILYYASSGDIKSLKALRENSPEVLEAQDYDERTTLHLAASEGRVETVQWLLEQGANPNPVDRWGGTPLQDALRNNHMSTVEVLNKHGARILKGGAFVTLAEAEVDRDVSSVSWEIDPSELELDCRGAKKGKKVGVDQLDEAKRKYPESMLGEGSFGAVYRMRWRGTTVAVKRLHRELLTNNTALTLFRAELNILCSLAHPNIVQFLGACTRTQPCFIITEFLDGGNVGDLMAKVSMQGPLTLKRATQISLDTARGMAYLHGKRPHAIIHRDLKPENILLDTGGRAKITDFGLSKAVLNVGGKGSYLDQNYKMTGGTGTWLMMAPEVYRKEHYSLKADVYSFAMIMYELYEGRRPFQERLEMGKDFKAVAFEASRGIRPSLVRTPEELKPLVRSMWSPDSEQRPSFEEIVRQLSRYSRRLSHPNAGSSNHHNRGCCSLC